MSTIDLSRLPPPLVVEPLSYEEILAEMVADLQARDATFTALTDADPAMKTLQVAAYREMLIRQRVNDAARSVMVAYAVGADLDQVGANIQVERLLLSPGDPEAGVQPTYESDEDFRRRIVLAPVGFSVAGPEAAYVFHALSAHADVRDASATSPSPGVVAVTVLSRGETGLPSAEVLAAVTARLATNQQVRPLTDNVVVQAATIIPYEVDATIYTYEGPDSSVVVAEARTRVTQYVERSVKLGRDPTISGLYGALQVEGVQRVVLHSPTADVAVTRTQAAICQSIQVEHGGVGE